MKHRSIAGLLVTVLILSAMAASAAETCPTSMLPSPDRLQLGPEHVTGGGYLVVLDPVANDRTTTGAPLSISSVEPGDPVTGQLTLNPDGTVTFRGQPGSVGSRLLFYHLIDETGEQLDGAITVQEGDAAACVASAVLDGFTVSSGLSSHSLNVLANDSTPSGCAPPGLVPFATPTGKITTARNGQAWVDAATRRIVYSPPSLFYSGAADSFTYSVQGSAGPAASTAVTVAFSGQTSPASATSSLFARTGLDVVMDSFQSHPSDLVCDPDPGDSRPEELAAYIEGRCWSFGDGGTLPTCDAVPSEAIYYVPTLLVLCVDEDGDGYHDPNNERCRVRYTAVRHSYQQPAEYTALLKIRDSCGQEDTGGTQLDLSNQAPVARISLPFPCAGLYCSFSGATSTDDYGIASYRWEFGHASPPAAGALVGHEFPALGTYRVALVLEDAHGATARVEKDVTLVDQPPAGMFEWSCADLTCTLTDHSTDDFLPLSEIRWRWRNRAMGTSGVIGLGSPIAFTAPVPGTYELTLIVTDSAGQPDPAPPVQTVDILGDLVAEPDWAALAPGQTVVDLPVLTNDRGPVGGLQVVALKPPSFGTASLVGDSVRYTANSGASTSVSDAFGYEVQDAAGNRAGGQIRVVRQPLAQVGRLESLSTTRQRVTFATAFSERPLVFAMPVSRVYPDPVSARVVAVDSTGFTIFLQEPEGTADGGAHVGETVTWLAVLPTSQPTGTSLIGGTATLDGATIIAAGRLTAATHAGGGAAAAAWASLRFPKPIVGPNVVVLAQTQTENDPAWVTTRVDEVGIEGFRLALQPREASLTAHGTETIAWLVMPVGVLQSGGGTNFEAGATAAVQTDVLRALEFSQVFPRPPLVLAGLTSARDLDPAVLRYRETFAGAIELSAQEEASAESDASHGAEEVGYLAFEEPALFAGSRDTLLLGAGDLFVLDDVAYYQPDLGPFKVCPIENDFATAGGLAITLYSGPRYGSVRFEPSGLLTYQPAPGVCEEVEIPYGVTDAAGRRAYGTVRMRCGTPPPAPPGDNGTLPIGPDACGQGGEGGGEEQ